MAANFWNSSQYRHWCLAQEDLDMRPDIVGNLGGKGIGKTKYEMVMGFYVRLIYDIAKQVPLAFSKVIRVEANASIRQQIIATAIVYFRRFYSGHRIRDLDPLLMCPTVLYVAIKVEEFGNWPLRVIRKATVTALEGEYYRTVFSNHFPSRNKIASQGEGSHNNNATDRRFFPYSDQDIIECEFLLLDIMSCYLVVYHPYLSLTKYLQSMGIKPDDHDTSEVIQTAWSIVNDSYYTDLCLIYAPHTIALAAIYMAVILYKDEKLKGKVVVWFAEVNIDMDEMMAVVAQLIVSCSNRNSSSSAAGDGKSSLSASVSGSHTNNKGHPPPTLVRDNLHILRPPFQK